MLCPYCMEIQDEAPSIFGEGPCSTPHCFKPSCCMDCPECSDWFQAIEPEEGEVKHPKAASPTNKSGTVSAGEVAPAAAPIKESPIRYSYRPTDDEAAVAATIANRRNTLNRNQTNIPGGETASKDERYRQHYRAVLAEIAVARLFNQSWTGCGKGAEGLSDVGGLLEVRSIDSRNRNLLVRGKDADRPMVLVLVTEDRNCEVLGWEYASVVREKGRVLGVGTGKEAHLLGVDKLRSPSELNTILDASKQLEKPPPAGPFEKHQKPQPKPDQGDIPW